MIKALKNKYALSNQGAKDLLKGIIYSVLANISLMFPVILLAIVLNQLLAPILGMNAPEISAIVYTVIGIVILAVVFIFHYCQYTAAYLGTYDESARRRISLAVIYGCIFTACHFFCFAKTKEAVITPEKEKISVKIQLKAVMQNRPYLLALAGQILFGFTLYGRNADILYYFTYVEGNASYYTTYSMCIIIPSIIGAACFQPLFRKLNNKGRTASLFALFTGISMLSMFFFNAKESPAIFYALSGLTQFFFSGFNTAIYAIIPDCVEYGEWKTGLRNDGFQYAFISLGNKIGMAVGTALLAGLLGKYGYIANQTQNAIVLSIMKHAFTTIPGVLWIVTAVVLFFYRLNKKRYNEIVEELKNGRKS